LLTVHDWRPYTIQYDDGKPDAWVGYSAWGSRGIALRFTPPSVPFRVEQIAIFGYGVIQKDFSQWDKREFLLRVWNRDMSQAVWYKHFPWRLFKGAVFGDWVNIDVPNIIVNGDFYVEVVTFSEPGVGGWVGDNALLVKAWRGDGDGRSILAEAGTLIPKTGPARDLNWCIRVKGRGP
jgi:hypothetical protein